MAGLSPETVKARTLAMLRQVALAGSRRRTLVVVVEDLQWIDRMSEEALAAFVDISSGGSPPSPRDVPA
jgi:predicted ATPase